MKKKVLLFNISSKEQRMKIRQALLPMDIAVKAVDKADYTQSMGYLTGNKQFPRTDAVYEGEELDGQMLLMSGLGGTEIERVLEALRKAGITRDCLKAMLTETNRAWDALSLYAEIRKEHDLMNGQAAN